MANFWKTIGRDLFRIRRRSGTLALFAEVLFGGSFKYVFWMRTSARLRAGRLGRVLYPFSRLMQRRYTYRFGISIPNRTSIGDGLYIGHFGGIVVNVDCVIGKNCNLSQGVTIGRSNRGARAGCPTIGDNVYIGPGAKIFGQIRVGNNVAIGANAVVTKDVPDFAVVAGCPARILSYEGVAGYVENTDYE